MALTVGAAAPDFTLRDQSQKEVKLSDYQGKKNVVVVFYPLDWSPTCTNEHVCFVNDMKNFENSTLRSWVLAWIACGRTRPSPKKWEFTIRCLPIFSRAAPSATSSACISRIRASPDAPSRLSTNPEKSPGSKITTFPRCRISKKFPMRSPT